MLIVNKMNQLDNDFYPKYLILQHVLYAENGQSYKYYVTIDVKGPLEDMFYDALDEKIVLSLVSGYRSFKRQKEIYENSIINNGIKHTEKYIAKPGFSEHQTGLAVDISSPSIYSKLINQFGDTKEGKWLKKNCHKYGFILRYPKGKEKITGYSFEPWHLRYVGINIAAEINKMDTTLEEWMENSKNI